VWTTDQAVAAEASVDLDCWRQGFGELMLAIGPRFARVEPRRRAGAFLQGLLAGLPRANCWTIAEHAGQACPRGMQRLLSSAVIDTDGLRDDLRAYVARNLGDPGAVLVIDETGDLKKGTKTVGVQRQYTGTAGRIENSQVAVYLVYAAPAGYAFIDRELYLPRGWTGDPDRCEAAGVPEDMEFATKPALGTAMIVRALEAGTPARWAADDEVYGNDPGLRAEIASRGLGFVLAVAKDHRILTGAGVHKAIDLAALLPARAWQRLPAGDGAKGPRVYDWALIDTTDPALPEGAQGANWLLIRRSIPASGSKAEYAFYRAHAPHPVPLSALVKVAGTRWKIEESFAGSKELAALDQHQVRGWTSWSRWTIFAMLAHAFLSVMTATQPPPREADGTYRDRNGCELVPLTRNEIRRLFTSLACQQQPIHHQLHWSCWRRRHQATARKCHYRRREPLTA
jgi:SRSO17 transposase